MEPIVITGVGVASPNGSDLPTFRKNMLEGVSGIRSIEVRHMGPLPAGVCDFDPYRYQTKKARRRGTRAGAIAIYCAHEALKDAGIDWPTQNIVDPSRMGVYLGITEHGNVETEEEIHLFYENGKDIDLWSHHHNPRTVANNPAGEVTIHLGVTGPHYTIGGACAAGNLGPIQAAQMLQLGEIDMALAGGVSESSATFGIFAAFKSEGALAFHESDPSKASRPLDSKRTGIVISEGGAILVMERLSSALKRGAKIYGVIAGYHVNSDATDFVLPNGERQKECIQKALKSANLTLEEINLISLHATGTEMGDVIEAKAVRDLFGHLTTVRVNGAKAMIGHTMGASGTLELVANLGSFTDGWVHPLINIDELDPECGMEQLVIGHKVEHAVKTILNNSFGMLGINSVLIVKKWEE